MSNPYTLERVMKLEGRKLQKAVAQLVGFTVEPVRSRYGVRYRGFPRSTEETEEAAWAATGYFHESRDEVQPFVREAVDKHGKGLWLYALGCSVFGLPYRPEKRFQGKDVLEWEAAAELALATPTDHCRALLLLTEGE